MKNKLFLLLLIGVTAFISIDAQSAYQKIADDTIAYVKAGTFGKPNVSKHTTKLALSQVRVHYKFISTQSVQDNAKGARVTVYLDGGMTEGDLQHLTDEFYGMLQQKLGALGIEFADWKTIQAADYYTKQQQESAKRKTTDGDVKSGQGWLSFTAFDGPVFIRWSPVTQTTELIAYGKQKDLRKMCEQVGADFSSFDVLVDFSSINLGTDVDTKWIGPEKYLQYKANVSVAPIMSAPVSSVLFSDKDMKFDSFMSKMPVVTHDVFAGKPYEDAQKASLKNVRFLGTEASFNFTPIVIEADRAAYLSAARSVLNAYVDLFVQKLIGLRGGAAGVKPSNPDKAPTTAQSAPPDTRTLQQINEKAAKNNEPTPQTYDEFVAAADDAIKAGNLKLAADYYGEAIKNGDNADLYSKRGVVYQSLKNYDAALKDFSQYIKLKPGDGLGYYNRGAILLVGKSDYKKAIPDFNQAIQLMPNYADAYLNRGLCFAALKKFEEAEKDLNAAIRIKPADAGIFRARAVVYKLQGKTVLAQADELKAAQLNQ